MQMITYARTLVVMLTILTSIAFGNLNAAADGKYYAGVSCYSVSTPLHYYYGDAHNASPEFVRVICPIIRDAETITEGHITVIDQNPQEDFECTMWVLGLNVDRVSLDTQHTEGSSASPKVLKFNMPRLNFNAKDTTYLLTCDMPPASNGFSSIIRDYWVKEKD